MKKAGKFQWQRGLAVILLSGAVLCGCQKGNASSAAASSAATSSAVVSSAASVVSSASSSKASSQSSSSKAESSAVSKVVSVSPVSSAAASKPVELPGMLEGKTIVSVESTVQKGVLYLTDEQKVYYYFDTMDRSGYMEKFKASSDLFTRLEGDWAELALPEPIVMISGCAALGKSGTVYLICFDVSEQMSYQRGSGSPRVCPHIDPLITVSVGEPVRQIFGDLGDVFIVTESGKLYSVGDMTLYGQLGENADLSNWLKPIPAVVPEPVDQVISTGHLVCIRGRSGAVYYAYRFLANEGFGDIPSSVRNGLPRAFTGAYFHSAGFSGVTQIAVGYHNGYKFDSMSPVQARSAIYLLKADGTVLRWSAEWLLAMRDSAALDSNKAELLKLNEKVTEIISSQVAVFLTEKHHLYSDWPAEPELLPGEYDYCISSTVSGFATLDRNGKVEGELLYVKSFSIKRPA